MDIENVVDDLDAGGGPGPASGLPSLSPSRASDFMTCPLLYRFRVIDRIPEPPTTATARGTLVHAVLERLFDRPAAERVPAAAAEMVEPEWARLCDENDGLAGLLDGDEERIRFIADAHAALTGYFKLEDPRRLEPAEREWYVEAELPSGLRLRGYVDRLDVSQAGDIRVVDYKTGKVPLEAYEASALFQMKFYALVIWRLRGVIPRVLQLMYLSGDGEVLRYSPDEADLRATERKLEALWAAISRARETGDWRPRPSRLCDWCRHKALCPEFGGTLPPLPEHALPAAAPAPADALRRGNLCRGTPECPLRTSYCYLRNWLPAESYASHTCLSLGGKSGVGTSYCYPEQRRGWTMRASARDARVAGVARGRACAARRGKENSFDSLRLLS